MSSMRPMIRSKYSDVSLEWHGIVFTSKFSFILMLANSIGMYFTNCEWYVCVSSIESHFRNENLISFAITAITFLLLTLVTVTRHYGEYTHEIRKYTPVRRTCECQMPKVFEVKMVLPFMRMMCDVCALCTRTYV